MRYIAFFLASLSLLLFGLLLIERHQLEATEIELSQERRNNYALTAQRDQAQEARAVERAMRERIAEDAARYQRLREEILRDEDYTFDDLLRDLRVLGLMRGDDPNGVRGDPNQGSTGVNQASGD